MLVDSCQTNPARISEKVEQLRPLAKPNASSRFMEPIPTLSITTGCSDGQTCQSLGRQPSLYKANEVLRSIVGSLPGTCLRLIRMYDVSLLARFVHSPDHQHVHTDSWLTICRGCCTVPLCRVSRLKCLTILTTASLSYLSSESCFLSATR